MKVLKEVTEWTVSTPNHIYFVNDSRDRMFGYVPQATGIPVRFSVPIRFETRGRQFRAVPNQWQFEVSETVSANPTWTVTGSQGDRYQVEKTQTGFTCTCSGFRFRGQCRHVKEIARGLGNL